MADPKDFFTPKATRPVNKVLYTPKFVFFWDPYAWIANWHKSEFVATSSYEDPPVERKYSCVEQYIMSEEALLFGDRESFSTIMSMRNPSAMRGRGHRIKNYDMLVWERARAPIATKGLYAKFTQHPDLWALLDDTGDRIIAEASSSNLIWGIGMRASNPLAQQPEKWVGQNLLGECLMRVRDQIREERGREATEKKMD